MSKTVKDYFRTILILVGPIGFVLQNTERKQEMLKVANFLLLAEPKQEAGAVPCHQNKLTANRRLNSSSF